MLDLLEEAKINGLRVGNAWVSTMWPSVLQKFTERTGVVKTKDHVINRLKIWKKIYKHGMKMLSKSRAGWDSTTGKVTIEEYQWSELITDNQAQSTRRRRGEGSSSRSRKRSKRAMQEDTDFMITDALREMTSTMKMFHESDPT